MCRLGQSRLNIGLGLDPIFKSRLVLYWNCVKFCFRTNLGLGLVRNSISREVLVSRPNMGTYYLSLLDLFMMDENI